MEYSIPGRGVTTPRLGFPWQDLFVFVLQLALSFSSPPQVDRFGEKSLLLVRTHKIFPTYCCSGLSEDLWANAYVIGRKLKLLLRLHFLCRSPALQADSLPAQPRGKPKNTGVGSFSSPGELPDPGIQQGSPALQVNSLPTELSEKPTCVLRSGYFYPEDNTGNFYNTSKWRKICNKVFTMPCILLFFQSERLDRASGDM